MDGRRRLRSEETKEGVTGNVVIDRYICLDREMKFNSR